MYAIPHLHSSLGGEALVSRPRLSPPCRDDGGWEWGPWWPASSQTAPRVTRLHTPTNCVLEGYFAKQNLMRGTMCISKLNVKMFLLGFNLTFFRSDPSSMWLDMVQISGVTQASWVTGTYGFVFFLVKWEKKLLFICKAPQWIMFLKLS